MLLVGGGQVPSALTATGVRIQVVGSAPLRSAVPLGFVPSSAGAGPVLVTWDVAGLDALAGLSGLYRTHSWLAPLTINRLRWWQLADVEDRLTRSQARLLLSGSQFSLSAPFTTLDQARAQAGLAPQRLLLAGGGAITALAMFIVLAGGGLRRDQRAELDRLRTAGARPRHCVLFVAVESGWLCAAALSVGAAVGIGAAALLASSEGEPAGAILMHSVITPAGLLTLMIGWLAATVLLGSLVLVRSARLTDLLAVAAASAVVAALAVGTGSDQALTLLLAPLCCAAAGVLTFRAAGVVLRGAERVARGGPVLLRLALVNLARSPGVPALAIAFIAVATGLGGFAVAYRSTLIRSAADQAANSVPLDVLVSAGPNFSTPLEVAPLQRWQALASGAVLPVRRTEANYTTGGGTVTVPALGIPAAGLAGIHGWREGDGSAPLATLARRLEPTGPVRAAGPTLPADAQWLSLRASAQGFPVEVTADLRDPQGAIRQVAFGTAGNSTAVLRARVPRGQWELEALELDEPTGLEITNGHQNGENQAAATQASARVALGPLSVLTAGGRSLPVPLGAWRGVGAAATTAPLTSGAVVTASFSSIGTPGVLRPAQPSDTLPVPVLADPQTAAAAGPDGRIAMTVDGLPVIARVVGVLSRFPTLDPGSGGFVIADEATLAGALDAQLPGQGRPDELWISTGHLAPGARGTRQRAARPARLLVPHRPRSSAARRAGGARGVRDADRRGGGVRGAGGHRVADGAARRSPRRAGRGGSHRAGRRPARTAGRAARPARARERAGGDRRPGDRRAADAAGGGQRPRRRDGRRSPPAGGDRGAVGGAGHRGRRHIRGARARGRSGDPGPDRTRADGSTLARARYGKRSTPGKRRPMTEAIVELRDVFCVHRTNEGDAAALAGTNLELGRGEVLCVLGPSGAGKSTLLRVVAGLQPPSAGVVRVAGRDIGRLPARSRSRVRHELMGFLGQHTDTALGPDLRMRDAVALPLALRGVPRPERRRRVDELFQITGLADRADARPGELSGGERQRFALCAALAHRPALLLADEPTGELDEASSDAVRALIVELARTNGTSVILVTHDPGTAGVADRTLRIRDGRIVSDRRAGEGQSEEALVVDGGWLRLPPDLLTQAGIGRRARAQPSPDGVIVTRATADSGPPAANARRPRPTPRHPRPTPRRRRAAGPRPGSSFAP